MPDPIAGCSPSPYSLPEDASSVCSTGLLPHILTGIFLQIVRHHFSVPENIIQLPLRRYVWHPDIPQCKIAVEAEYNWTPAALQQRPAVVVKRGDLKSEKLSIGNVFHGPPEEEGFAEDRMIVAFQGSHTLFCCGRTGTEAELLGAEVAYELLEFSQIIRQQFNLMLFDLHQIGQVHRLQESHDHFAVPITLAYAFSHGWRVLRQRPIWMRFELDIDSQ